MTLKFKHVAWPTHSCPTCNGPINPDEVILNPAQKQRLLTELQKHLANSPFLSDLKPKLQNLFDQMRLPLTAFTFKQVISSGLDRIFHYLPLGILTRHTEKIVNTNKIIQKEDATFRDILRASQKMFDIVNEATKKGEIVRKAYLLSFFKDASLAQESLEKIITNLIDSGTLKPVYHLKNELYYQWDFCDSKVGIYSKAQLRQRFPDRFSKPDSRKRRKTESKKK